MKKKKNLGICKIRARGGVEHLYVLEGVKFIPRFEGTYFFRVADQISHPRHN